MKNFLMFLFLMGGILSAQNESEKYGVSGEDIPVGLPLGEQAPAFSGIDQFGQSLTLQELLKGGPVVIMFYRGSWFPVCNRYLAEIADSLYLIKEAGATLLAITPNIAEKVADMDEDLEGAIRIVSDSAGSIMDSFKVSFVVTQGYQHKIQANLQSDIAKANNQDEARLPVPATFIINPNGEIIWRHFDLNYKNRASVKSILANLPQ